VIITTKTLRFFSHSNPVHGLMTCIAVSLQLLSVIS